MRLRRFRQGSMLAVSLTALLLLVWGIPADIPAQEPEVPAEPMESIPLDPAVSLEQATGTLRDLFLGFYGFLPKLVLALILLALASGVSRLTRCVVKRVLGGWDRSEAMSALLSIGIYLLALGAVLSVLAGDIRALVGSLGLVGLALSWALQTPIESFAGWVMNSFRNYYRVGDRIEVGDVFGDVYKMDILTTTVWEAGGPGKAVAGAQSTGALITFPNWEVLRSNIINYSREFPYVWDEVTVSVANESDLQYCIDTFEAVARRVVGSQMTEPVKHYRQLLDRAKLALDVAEEPKVFLSQADAWMNCTVRYLVNVRTRRRIASDLILALTQESSRPEHKDRIIPSYPRTEVRLKESWVPESG